MSESTSNPDATGSATASKVLFFDIDNCLYPKSAKVQDLMAGLIEKYLTENLNLFREDAVSLNKNYYQTYGLAIEGLVRHHKIDPLEYNAKVDDALPLEGVITPRAELARLLADVDRSRVRLWLFTNAYVNHAKRVIRLMELEGVFDGLTYCDYVSVPLIYKPRPEMYAKAMREAGVERPEDCYFVDDSYQNCQKAQELGWTTAHLVEEGVKVPVNPASKFQIRHLEELRDVFPELFQSLQKKN